MVGVPAVWETIRKGIIGKATAGGRVRESVFRGAVEAKRKCVFFLDAVFVSSSDIADGFFFAQGHTRAGQARRQRGAERGEGPDGREVCGFLFLCHFILLACGIFPTLRLVRVPPFALFLIHPFSHLLFF
jgi:hypothetical protein